LWKFESNKLLALFCIAFSAMQFDGLGALYLLVEMAWSFQGVTDRLHSTQSRHSQVPIRICKAVI
jgi:hypothetical protein